MNDKGMQFANLLALIFQLFFIALRGPRVVARKARLGAQAGSHLRSVYRHRDLKQLKAPVGRRRRPNRGRRASGKSGDEMEVDQNLLENQVESKLMSVMPMPMCLKYYNVGFLCLRLL